MRKLYITLTILAISAGLTAQTQDSLLKTTGTGARFQSHPALMQTRLNSLPSLREPEVQKANTNYSTWAGRITPPLDCPAASRQYHDCNSLPERKGISEFSGWKLCQHRWSFYRLIEKEKHQLRFTFHPSIDKWRSRLFTGEQSPKQ